MSDYTNRLRDPRTIEEYVAVQRLDTKNMGLSAPAIPCEIVTEENWDSIPDDAWINTRYNVACQKSYALYSWLFGEWSAREKYADVLTSHEQVL